MEENPKVTLLRAGRTLRSLIRPAVHPHRLALAVTAHHVGGEPISLDEALTKTFQPFQVGDAWGPAWDTTWFRCVAEVPAAWAGSRVVARLDLGHTDPDPGGTGGFGAEGLAWADGRPLQGVSSRHPTVLLHDKAEGGEPVDLLIEAAANVNVAGSMHGLRRTWREVDVGGPPLLVLRRAELAVVDPGVAALAADVTLALELVEQLREDEPRWHEVVEALDLACNRLDGTDVSGSAERAVEPLRAALERPSHHQHRVSAVGHAHMDTAWLWPMRETKRKLARTFSSALRLMEEFPDYVFVASAPQHWAWMKDEQPALFDRMRAAVVRGQLEPVGAMWVEPDCNIPSGESLIRQVLHGWRWFRDELGVEVRDVWLPDVFGYPAALPTIMAGAGLDRFLTQKLSWNRTNEMPHRSFWWEGLDGSRTFAHFPPADTYNAELSVDQLVRQVRSFKDHRTGSRSLLLYGYGDGGGGPTRELLERSRRVASLDPLPPVTLEPSRRFFDAAVAEADERGAPVWVGELYFEMHRGTYTSQAAAKRANRRMEDLLREIELWSTLAPRDDDLQAWLDRTWKEVLTLQFHDIIPGSSITWVYDDARIAYERMEREGTARLDHILGGAMAVVVNPTDHERTEVVGAEVVRVPPFAAIPLSSAVVAADDAVALVDHRLSNRHLCVTWDDAGLLTSILDLDADGREVLAGRANVLQLLVDRPATYDAWDVDGNAFDQVTDWLATDRIWTAQPSPLVGQLWVERSHGATRLRQCVELRAGSRRIDVRTWIDWQERETMLKVAFPVAVRSHRATYEVQLGAVERPTHRNTSWDAARFEVPAQRWADLSEAGYGVALLNDGKWGYDTFANVLRLSLLRSPSSPDPEADRGEHTFTYALLPHAGGWQEAGVVTAADDLGRPLRVVTGGRPIDTVVRCDAPGVVVEAVKKPEDGEGTIVRLYESRGGATSGRLHVGTATAADVVDLLERPIRPLEVVDGCIQIRLSAFELVTVRLGSGA